MEFYGFIKRHHGAINAVLNTVGHNVQLGGNLYSSLAYHDGLSLFVVPIGHLRRLEKDMN